MLVGLLDLLEEDREPLSEVTVLPRKTKASKGGSRGNNRCEELASATKLDRQGHDAM